MWIGITLGLTLLAFCFLVNYFRAPDRPIGELVPNCLLTRYPLVFVPGPRSLFYFLKYWNEIPHFLASHGYEVFSLSLPWKSSLKRKEILKHFLSEKSKNSREKLHLFFDQSSAVEISDLLRENSFSCLASVTWVKTSKDSDAFLTQVRGLSSPLEEVILNDKNFPVQKSGGPFQALQKLFWKIHLMLSGQSINQKIETRGYKLGTEFQHLLLARSQFLAERDLLHNQSSPTL